MHNRFRIETQSNDNHWYARWLWLARIKGWFRQQIDGEETAIRDMKSGRFVRES